jgi:hypothetical protein
MRIGIAIVLSAMSLHVHAANAPCDASVPIKGCRAEIKLEGNWIVLTSNTQKCSVIEWTLDGSFRQTTVLDGEERIELLTTKPKELTVESCTQVKDLRALRSEDQPVAAHRAPAPTPFAKYCTHPDLTLEESVMERHGYTYCFNQRRLYVWCSDTSGEPVEVPLPAYSSAPGASTRAIQEGMRRMDSLCRK